MQPTNPGAHAKASDAPTPSDILRGLGSRRWPASVLFILFIGLLGAVLGILAASLLFLGQILALGWGPALDVYGVWLVRAGLGGAALLVLFLIMAAAGAEIDAFFTRNEGTPHRLLNTFFAVALVAFIVWFGYHIAETENEILVDHAPLSPAHVQMQVDSQAAGLSRLSADARTVLQQLDRSQERLAEARTALEQQLREVSAQIRATEEASRRVSSLNSRQQQIEVRSQELARLLEGKEPITREDLDRSGREGLLLGAILGFIGNVAATWAYGHLARRFRKRREPSGDQSGLRD